jgi:hypothetical protein
MFFIGSRERHREKLLSFSAIEKLRGSNVLSESTNKSIKSCEEVYSKIRYHGKFGK